MRRLKKYQIRFFANLFTNLTAGFIGVVFLAPNFGNIFEFPNFLILIYDIGSAILYAGLALKMERKMR